VKLDLAFGGLRFEIGRGVVDRECHELPLNAKAHFRCGMALGDFVAHSIAPSAVLI
jgi:hypothetical protein